MKKYIVLSSSYSIEDKEGKALFESTVNNFLNNGWELVGGVALHVEMIESEGDSNYLYPKRYLSQALVKDE